MVSCALFNLLVVPFSSEPAFPLAEGLLWALVAGACEAGYFVTLGRALKESPLSIAYTVSRGGAVLLVWPVAMLLFAEPLSPLSALAALTVMGGLAVASGFPGRGTAARGVLWAASCAVFIAAYHLCYKRSLALGAAPAALTATSLALAATLHVLGAGDVARKEAFALVRRTPWRVVLTGCLAGTGFLLFRVGLRAGGAAEVFTLRNTSVVFAQVLALAIGERPARAQWMGAGLVTAGAVLLSWPRV